MRILIVYGSDIARRVVTRAKMHVNRASGAEYSAGGTRITMRSPTSEAVVEHFVVTDVVDLERLRGRAYDVVLEHDSFNPKRFAGFWEETIRVWSGKPGGTL